MDLFGPSEHSNSIRRYNRNFDTHFIKTVLCCYTSGLTCHLSHYYALYGNAISFMFYFDGRVRINWNHYVKDYDFSGFFKKKEFRQSTFNFLLS